jgi:hypothetical protein
MVRSLNATTGAEIGVHIANPGYDVIERLGRPPLTTWTALPTLAPMPLRRLVISSVAVIVLAWTTCAWAGWIIDQVATGNRWKVQQRVLLDGNRMKTVMLGADGSPVTTFILDLNTGRIVQADYAGGQYITGTVQEYLQLMQWLRQQAKESHPAIPGNCRAFRIEVTRTGQQATIAGYPAVRYDVMVDGTLQSEAWMAANLPAWREINARKLEQFVSAIAKLGTCGPEHVRQWFFAADPGAKALDEGFPVRIIDRSNQVTIDIVTADARAVPRDEFEPPANLGPRTIREIINP